jgi:hypothetical protein
MLGTGNRQLGAAAVTVGFGHLQISIRKFNHTCNRNTVPGAQVTVDPGVALNGVQIDIHHRELTRIHMCRTDFPWINQREATAEETIVFRCRFRM